MKELKILIRKRYNGESKLGYLLDDIKPRYVSSDQISKCSDNVGEIRKESIGQYTIEFLVPLSKLPEPNIKNDIYTCKHWVNFISF